MRSLLLGAVALIAAGCGQAAEGRGNVVESDKAVEGNAAPQQGARGSDVTMFSGEDAAMNGAIADARRTLPQFLQRLEAGELADADPMIKAGLRTPDGGLEHIWVAEPRVEGDRLTGLLANEPYQLPGLRRGSSVTFTRGEVSDWSYTRGERMWGNYTTRVMLERLDPQQAAELEAALSPTPTEP